MESQRGNNSEADKVGAAGNVAGAHKILQTLQEKIGPHPEIGEAITKLEMALNILAVKTGGVL
ncbi:MAG: hypothetical protein WCC95_13470 [Candidatus Sulfotelmatobacter sp.]|jgi:hypothetical protein